MHIKFFHNLIQVQRFICWHLSKKNHCQTPHTSSPNTTFSQSQSGQGMTEYLLIVALVALSAVVVYRYLGATISNKTAAIALAITEQNTDAADKAANKAATDAANAAAQKNN